MDGRMRFCVNYRRLNDVTVKDTYPLPRVDDMLDIGGATYFGLGIDLASGYWQIPVHPNDRVKAAFTMPDGYFQFQQMPFGLCNEPGHFRG